MVVKKIDYGPAGKHPSLKIDVQPSLRVCPLELHSHMGLSINSNVHVRMSVCVCVGGGLTDLTSCLGFLPKTSGNKHGCGQSSLL